VNVNGLFDYALTKDQTLRFGYSQNNNARSNQGVGSYDLPERAFRSDNSRYQFRALEAGPIGRRTFINTRLTMAWMDFGNQSSVEAPTIIVQDAFTSGGAQQAGRVHGKNMTFASDVDYVRGIHSWRGGVQVYADWYRANLSNNYLGTYVFSNLAAYEAGTPLLYTRSVGDPRLDFFHARTGVYFQDDLRIRKGLTLSPGLRYSYQTAVPDTLRPMNRASASLGADQERQHDAAGQRRHLPRLAGPGIWWQTVRSDSEHQRDIIITNPSYPTRALAASPRRQHVRAWRLQAEQECPLQRRVDQRSRREPPSTSCSHYYHQDQLPRGTNLNPLSAAYGRPRVWQRHLDGHRRGTHPARGLRQLQRHLMRPSSSPATRRSTGGGWRRTAATRTFARAQRDRTVRRAGHRLAGNRMGHGPGRQPLPPERRSDEHADEESVHQHVAQRVRLVTCTTQTTGLRRNHDGLLNDRRRAWASSRFGTLRSGR
jgi:hypothetical protein